MTDTPSPSLPSIGDQVLASLHGFLSAAALHLGEPSADGAKLAAPDPQEAWRALLAAVALADRLGPVMPPAELALVEAPLARLLERFAELHPDLPLATPGIVSGEFRMLERLGWPGLR
ncbi:MAG: hypothetical protein JWM80_1352 [Cyanobacteria bacterium RYN_339]|nr:hypothetical protein [Cyanobacteria bacterium RYN_339]